MMGTILRKKWGWLVNKPVSGAKPEKAQQYAHSRPGAFSTAFQNAASRCRRALQRLIHKKRVTVNFFVI
jgi:hypothetical protein